MAKTTPTNLATTDDALLSRWARLGDDAALATLVERHYKQTFAFLHKALGDDENADNATQAAFWRLANRAQAQAYGARFEPALEAAVNHTATAWIERQEPQPIATKTGGATLEQAFGGALTHLAASDRLPLLRRYRDKRLYRELAENCGSTSRTMQISIHGAMRKLCSDLTDAGFQPTRTHVKQLLVNPPSSPPPKDGALRTCGLLRRRIRRRRLASRVVKSLLGLVVLAGLIWVFYQFAPAMLDSFSGCSTSQQPAANTEPSGQAAQPTPTSTKPAVAKPTAPEPQPTRPALERPTHTPAPAVVAAPAFTIEVVERASTAAIADAQVIYVSDGETARISTDSQGMAALPRRLNPICVAVSAEGHARTVVALAGLSAVFADATTLAADKPLVVKLEPERIVRGQVAQTQGNAPTATITATELAGPALLQGSDIAAAFLKSENDLAALLGDKPPWTPAQLTLLLEVISTCKGTGLRPVLVRAGAEGRFEIRGLGTSTRSLVHLRTPGFVDVVMELDGTSSDVGTVLCDDGGQVAGSVVDQVDQGPVPNSAMRLYPTSLLAPFADARSVFVSNTGSFKLAGLVRGSYVADLSAPGYKPYRQRLDWSQTSPIAARIVLERDPDAFDK